jgi:hypothetical protein
MAPLVAVNAVAFALSVRHADRFAFELRAAFGLRVAAFGSRLR